MNKRFNKLMVLILSLCLVSSFSFFTWAEDEAPAAEEPQVQEEAAPEEEEIQTGEEIQEEEIQEEEIQEEEIQAEEPEAAAEAADESSDNAGNDDVIDDAASEAASTESEEVQEEPEETVQEEALSDEPEKSIEETEITEEPVQDKAGAGSDASEAAEVVETPAGSSKGEAAEKSGGEPEITEKGPGTDEAEPENTRGAESEEPEESDVIASGSCGNSATWTLTGTDDNMVLTISGTGKMTDYNDIVNIPWIRYCGSIKEVVVNKGIKQIGYNAFYNCTAMTSAVLPSSLTAISSRVFSAALH